MLKRGNGHATAALPRHYPNVSLSEAVTFLATGIYKDRPTLFRAYRKAGYKLSSSANTQFDQITHQIAMHAAGGRFELRGQKRDSDGADLQPLANIPADFFKDPITFDVMRDRVEPDSEVGDNWMNPFPQYHNIRLNMIEIVHLIGSPIKQPHDSARCGAAGEPLDASKPEEPFSKTRSGYGAADRAHFAKISQMLKSGQARGAYSSALILANAGNLAGSGSPESKAKRVAARYLKENSAPEAENN